MRSLPLSRLLGWFSLALGASEITLGGTLARGLGLRGGPWLVRLFGVREVAAGIIVLARPDAAYGPAARVAGDALDIAALLAAGRRNPHRSAARAALALVLAVSALDVFCTAALIKDERQRARIAQRTGSPRPVAEPAG